MNRSSGGRVILLAQSQDFIATAYLRLSQGIADTFDMGVIEVHERSLMAALDPSPADQVVEFVDGQTESAVRVNPTFAPLMRGW